MKLRFPRFGPRRSVPVADDEEHVPWRQAIVALERACHKEERARLEARYGPADTWPRLSETLTGPRHPRMCQSCGMEQRATRGEPIIAEEVTERKRKSFDAPVRLADRQAEPAPGISAWQEHDEDDQPDPNVVMLCPDCSDRLVGPHPRLYRRLVRNEPCAGIMDLCLECAFRAGVRCTSPTAGFNGGPGLEFDHDPPRCGHIYYGTGRGGRFFTIYPSPVRSCSGRQPILGRSSVQ